MNDVFGTALSGKMLEDPEKAEKWLGLLEARLKDSDFFLGDEVSRPAQLIERRFLNPSTASMPNKRPQSRRLSAFGSRAAASRRSSTSTASSPSLVGVDDQGCACGQGIVELRQADDPMKLRCLKSCRAYAERKESSDSLGLHGNVSLG
eukprot:4941718-Prymnesium_polylepis.1